MVTEWVQSSIHPQKFVRPGSPGAAAKVREKLISTEANEIEPMRRVTLFSKRFKPRYYEHPSTAGPFRDYAWYQIVRDFRDKLENRELQLHDIEEYAAEHPLMHEVGTWKDRFWETRRVGE